MIRVLFLAAPGSIIALGFALPFLVAGRLGLASSVATIAVGSWLLWLVESKTRKSLRENTKWNRLMTADGDELITEKEAD